MEKGKSNILRFSKCNYECCVFKVRIEREVGLSMSNVGIGMVPLVFFAKKKEHQIECWISNYDVTQSQSQSHFILLFLNLNFTTLFFS